MARLGQRCARGLAPRVRSRRVGIGAGWGDRGREAPVSSSATRLEAELGRSRGLPVGGLGLLRARSRPLRAASTTWSSREAASRRPPRRRFGAACAARSATAAICQSSEGRAMGLRTCRRSLSTRLDGAPSASTQGGVLGRDQVTQPDRGPHQRVLGGSASAGQCPRPRGSAWSSTVARLGQGGPRTLASSRATLHVGLRDRRGCRVAWGTGASSSRAVAWVSRVIQVWMPGLSLHVWGAGPGRRGGRHLRGRRQHDQHESRQCDGCRGPAGRARATGEGSPPPAAQATRREFTRRTPFSPRSSPDQVAQTRGQARCGDRARRADLEVSHARACRRVSGVRHVPKAGGARRRVAGTCRVRVRWPAGDAHR